MARGRAGAASLSDKNAGIGDETMPEAVRFIASSPDLAEPLLAVLAKDYDTLCAHTDRLQGELAEARQQSVQLNGQLFVKMQYAEIKAEAELAALRSVVEAAKELQECERWVTAERMINRGAIAGPGNRLASALAALDKRRENQNN